MFSAPLPLRARVCRHIYRQEVSLWGAFRKVRVLIHPWPLGSKRYVKLHRGLLTQFYHSVFCYSSEANWESRKHGRELSFSRTASSVILTRWMSCILPQDFFSLSAWFLNVFCAAVPLVSSRRGLSSILWKGGYDTICSTLHIFWPFVVTFAAVRYH